jgi:hypothetical protein
MEGIFNAAFSDPLNSEEERIMYRDPIFLGFIIYCAINAIILIRVWWLTIGALIDLHTGR